MSEQKKQPIVLLIILIAVIFAAVLLAWEIFKKRPVEKPLSESTDVNSKPVASVGLSLISLILGVLPNTVKILLNGYKWLNRRSHRKLFSWKSYLKYLECYPLPMPKIVHNQHTLSPVI